MKLNSMWRQTACALAVGWMLTAQVAAATDLRGRVDSRHPYSGYPFPRPGAEVVLFYWGGNGWYPATTTITGADGMYYLPGVGNGNYQLRINGLWFPLTVYPQPYQDIPPVLVP